jgi:signal transduction histidine kinase
VPRIPGKLRQVLVNLVENAIKYAGGRIEVRVEPQYGRGMRGQISVHSIPGEGSTFSFELPLYESR